MSSVLRVSAIRLLALIGVISPALRAGETPELRTLKNEVLSVGVMDPAHPQRYNRGVRFTPLAAVLGVRRDGVEYLYHPADHDPLTDHGGLAAEFDLCVPQGPEDSWPPGYGEAGIGEGFLKIGVGVLKKEKEAYTLFRQPPVIERAETSVAWTADSALFRQVCRGAGTSGYAYSLEARVELLGNRVITHWTLVNTGNKAFTTRQYAHNFFRIAEHDVGPGYSLSFPYDFQASGLEGGQSQEGRTIKFLSEIPKWINAVVAYPTDYHGINSVLVRHADSGRSILCETSLPGLRTDIHARTGFLSPEQFIEITLKPNESKAWKRTYTFN